MRRELLVIGAVVASVLLPMWFVAMQGEPPSEEIAIDQSVSDVRPLDGFVDAPNKLSPSQVGTIVWIALFALVGVLAAAHRFMNYAVRPSADRTEGTTETDGGRAGTSWLATDERWVVEYARPSEQAEGLIAMAGLTIVAIVFAALFVGEYLTLARTQYFGVYAAAMFLALAGSTVAYYAWFMPHVEVAEYRDHRRRQR